MEWIFLPLAIMGGFTAGLSLLLTIGFSLGILVGALIPVLAFGAMPWILHGVALLLFIGACITTMYLCKLDDEKAAARWQRKYDGGMLP